MSCFVVTCDKLSTVTDYENALNDSLDEILPLVLINIVTSYVTVDYKSYIFKGPFVPR